ncbi:MAG: aldo/keto reductase [Cyclobacteriaceae bacterium]
MSKLIASPVITGLWQIADMERDGKQTDHKVLAGEMKRYIDAGLDTFDMADHYGSSELITGRLIKDYPGTAGKFFTKWVPDPANITKEETRKAVVKALERMNLQQLPLLQFHAWQYANPNWLDCLWWLEELRDEGLIAGIGVTNFDTVHLDIALKSGIKIVSNQVCFSLLDQRAFHGFTGVEGASTKQEYHTTPLPGSMLELCEREGVALLAFGTVAGGFLTEKWIGKPEPTGEQLSNWSLMKYKRFIDTAGGWDKFQSLLSVLHELATEKNVSVANIASAYILGTTGVSSVIIGARLGERSHIKSNLKLKSLKLDEKERRKFGSVISSFHPIPGDCGDEYRKPPYLTASGDLSHHLSTLPKPFKTELKQSGRLHVYTGTVWEPMAGYSRAVRTGNEVHVSGTTATHNNRVIGGNDPAAQTHFILDKIEGALLSAGATMEEIVRTRIFIKSADIWEPVARAHGRRLGHVMPANTMVTAGMIGEEYLVEVEVELRMK